ncbi:uncharacterized protein K460DRAFT_392372 [Cucurbitaria berberidis CBS 394.84]|uniref:Uncharacterized protein n=1 Tax=Cucurbitaria berberidis CBS 394.84 TaxID=1168544 RepID=A0A9P4LA11_9PLEO|nr:uncharacterized protein K460DRAFT_392372 [Cucurbitaria berberidis CBS 394.84]KAF1846892.1 hypothetical protein K460DRAFT_392372 [Cucurbitaria berberidis CBS 394.84]
MAVGRIQGSLASAYCDVTVAAANANFDFTLIKLEAAKEFDPLASALTAIRKHNAENGAIHILARQLGALFQGSCPAAPGLLEAYGKRVSEIAQGSKSIAEPYINTFFGEYVGVDGTAIWAAATSADSSNSAIHVHLLACMLARMWKPEEAVSIWAELVDGRKREIAQELERGAPVNGSLVMAAAQPISHYELTAWDNSVRAWLCTANDFCHRKQKQLELIVDNLGLPVSRDPKVYPGVIDTWKTAVETMDKLIAGVPQAVQNGATHVAFAAWHLYPNMLVYSPEAAEVKMNDPLVREGGVMSLGLSANPRTSLENNGVYWSLSLAQLRYYGPPVPTERVLGAESRITLPQLSLVIFSAVLTEWGLSGAEYNLVAEVIISLVDYLDGVRQDSKSDRRFLKLLRDGASAYAQRAISDHNLHHKLIQLGRRRSENLIRADTKASKNQQSAFFFNLLEPASFMHAFKDVESQVMFFRHVAARVSPPETPADTFLIRYVQVPVRSDGKRARKANGGGSYQTNVGLNNGHLNGSIDVDMDGLRLDQCGESRHFPESSQSHHGGSSRSKAPFIYSVATALPHSDDGTPGVATHHRWFPENLHNAVLPAGEIGTMDAGERFRCWDSQMQVITADDPDANTYHVVLGDPTTAALYTKERLRSVCLISRFIELQDFLWCLQHNLLDPAVLFGVMRYHPRAKVDRLRKTMQALATAAIVYDDLPGVTIDVGILNRTVLERPWVQFSDDGLDNLSMKFSLISYFESGVYDVPPSELQDVIALSSTNSLFVAGPLIRDPYESLAEKTTVRRILGNIGKPGITFLLPPKEPMIREINANSWRVDSYRPFDGTTSCSFQNTSVHLSFTEFNIPLYDGSRSARDNQVFLQESVISVRDKGEWVADVDPLPLLQYGPDARLRALPTQVPCQHSKVANPNQEIIAVDSWNELLDRPEGLFVVRTGSNWIARLASTLVAYQRMRETSTTFAITVCPPEVCWICTKQAVRNHAFIF